MEQVNYEEFEKIFPPACKDIAEFILKHGEHMGAFVCAITVCRYLSTKEKMIDRMDKIWNFYESLEKGNELEKDV